MVNFEMNRRYQFQSIMNIHRVLFILFSITQNGGAIISQITLKAAKHLDYKTPFFLRDSRESKTQVCVKITPCEKGGKRWGERNMIYIFLSLPVAYHLFSRGMIFTRARVSLALISPRKKEGLLVVYKAFCILVNSGSTLLTL